MNQPSCNISVMVTISMIVCLYGDKGRWWVRSCFDHDTLLLRGNSVDTTSIQKKNDYMQKKKGGDNDA